MDKLHYLDDYLMAPTHPISVAVIGCGGTGSKVLIELANLHMALEGIGRVGLSVYAYDPKDVSEANVVRQRFYPEDVGSNKAATLISRINRSYGFNWKGIPNKYGESIGSRIKEHACNIIISCVDSAATRFEVASLIYDKIRHHQMALTHLYCKMIYWIDTGNGNNFSQVAMGTINPIMKKDLTLNHAAILPSPIELFKGMEDSYDSGVSCSAAESLMSQDLYVNSWAALSAVQMLWSLLKAYMISYNQVYINLRSMKMNYKLIE